MRSRRTDWPTAIADSYRRLVGEPLCAPTELEDLPAVVLCHDDSVDPILVFANRAARDLWEAPLVGMPSRLTAPPEQLTLMLYNGAVRFVDESIAALEAKDFSRSNERNF